MGVAVCGRVTMYGSSNVWEFRYMGVADCASCRVRELQSVGMVRLSVGVVECGSFVVWVSQHERVNCN